MKNHPFRLPASMRVLALFVLALFALSPSICFGQVVEKPQVLNLSTLSPIGEGDKTLNIGFGIGVDNTVSAQDAQRVTKTLLIRAVSQSIKALNVKNVAANPKLVIYDITTHAVIDSNDDWGNSQRVIDADNQTGAFPLALNSTDAAIVISLKPGTYSVVITDPTSIGGVVLAEIYDISRDLGHVRLVNLSTRTALPSTGGIIVDGKGSTEKLLIRGIGPGLAQFGVTSVAQNPTLTLYSNVGAVMWSGNDWPSYLTPVFTSVGAFTLPAGSHDTAVLWPFVPNGTTSMTFQVTGTSGVALLEVYEVP